MNKIIKKSNYESKLTLLEQQLEDNLMSVWILADSNYGTTEKIIKQNDTDTKEMLKEREIFFRSALETLNSLSLQLLIQGVD